MPYESYLVIAGIAAEAIVLASIYRRRIYRFHPIFTAYMIWAVASDVSFIAAPNLYQHKIFSYIIEIGIDSFLQFMVMVELMLSALRPVRNSLPKWIFFLIPFLIMLVGAFLWPLAGFTVQSNLDANSHILVNLQQVVSLLRVVLMLALVAFSQFLSIGWRDRELQIASGLGFYSILSLVIWVLHTHQAVGSQYHWLDLVTSFGYLGTLAYWVVSFAQKEPEARKISPQMMRFLVSIGGSLQADRLALETAVKKKPGKYNHR